MPTAVDLKREITELSTKAYEVATDSSKTFVERKEELDKIEPEIKAKTIELADVEKVEKARKAYSPETAADADPEDGKKGHDMPAADRAKAKSLGQQFIESDNYKTLMDRGLAGTWTSGAVELKTLLTEGTAGSPGGGNALVATPAVLPGIVDLKLMDLTVADLIPGGSTSSPLIRYLVETAITNAAAGVAEGASKPESSIEFDKADESLKKIATFFSVTDEMLEDFEQIRSYLDARLELFVRHEEEAQLLTGDGTNDTMVGILNRTGLSTEVVRGTAPSAADDNAMDAIYRQITRVRTTSFLEPDNIVQDPIGWEKVVLTKSEQGVYYAGGPFMNVGRPTLWGKPVTVTPRMTALEALVGAFRTAAQVFRKGGITVEASNSHGTYFKENKTAIRAETREALAVYRPAAFGVVSNL